ncbi:MAG: glycoside hydrolase family 32 protein [Chloroflexota bacterium]
MHHLVTHRYLNVPVKNGAPKRRLRVEVGGAPFDEFEIELSPAEPDFWVFLDLAGQMGKPLTISSDGEDAAQARALQADAPVGSEQIYQERLRPQFHFSARRGWHNDPNGLLYAHGRYHLFFQHNPYGWAWGNMHWGHAVSHDLVHWQEWAEALYPDDLGTMFSGCAVVDWPNSSGLQTGHDPTLVLLYTAAGDTSAAAKGRPYVQCLAFSNDRGRSWTKYAGNPVLDAIVAGNRDPKVIWHAPSARWVMALYLDGNDFALFTSPDLQRWTRSDDLHIPGCTECPDFFPLAVDGDRRQMRWVFWGANGSYLLGNFDGATFTAETEVLRAYAGSDGYAAQTWSDIPAADGRRVQISWFKVALAGMPFNQCMTFPCALTLRITPDGIRLCSEPVQEIETLYAQTRTWRDQALTDEHNLLAGISGDLFDLQAEVALGTSTAFGCTVRGVTVTYDVEQQQLTCLGTSAPLAPIDGVIRLRLLVDRASLEIFGNDGLLVLPLAVAFEEAKHHPLGLFARGGTADVRSLAVSTLRSIWR